MKLTLTLTFVFIFCQNALANKYTYMPKNKIKRPEELVGPLRDDEEFLSAISQLESSGNINTAHKTMKTGIHAGDTAVGQFGIMPNTVREVAKRLKRRDSRLNLAPQFQGDPEIEQYADETIPQDVLQFAMEQNPDMVDRTARYMRELVRTRFKDPEKMAYAWNMGHNQPEKSITSEKLDESEYVRRFRNLRNLASNKK